MPELTWIGKGSRGAAPCGGALSLTGGGEGAFLSADRRRHGESDRAGGQSGGTQGAAPALRRRVKCIYIDPPYNTGNEGWVYNDAVNSPEIRQWLGVAVGKEAEDLSRHDKWLCMMYPRLVLLRQFLREDGADLHFHR